MGALSSHALPHQDDIDLKILYELEQDCRRSLEEIAKMTGLSKQTLHYRIQRLVEGGVITGFITAIDAAKLGYENHDVWIQLNVLDEKRKEGFVEYLIAHENIGEIATCQGKFDLKISVLAENVVRFNSVFKEILRKFPGHMKNQCVSVPFERAYFSRSYLIQDEKEKRHQMRFENEPKRIGIDAADAKILCELSKNAKIALNDLAKAAGISPNTARQRIGRLEKEGVMRGYTILIQLPQIGMSGYELLVSTQNIMEEDEKDMGRFCIANNNVSSFRKVIGKWDLEISFDAQGSEEFQEFLTGFRSRFSNVIKEFEYVPILYVHKMDYLPMKNI